MSEFLGHLVTEMLPHETRKVVVYFDFAFLDSNGKLWPTFRGDLIDGATIPPLFWTIFGSPYTGPYRRAAAPHDTAYQYQLRSQIEADRMIEEAALCDKTGETKAWLIERAVRNCGRTYWEDLDQGDHNINLVPEEIRAVPCDVFIPMQYRAELAALKEYCFDRYNLMMMMRAKQGT